MAMNKAEKAKLARMESVLAAALYGLNAIAVREDLLGCENHDDLCRGLCEECGCIEFKRRLIIKTLDPKTIEDFGYEDVTKSEDDGEAW